MGYFFPILAAPGCSGWTTVFNFPPNDWEDSIRIDRYLNVTWSDGVAWNSYAICKLKYGEVMRIDRHSLLKNIPEHALALLSLTQDKLPNISDSLDMGSMPSTGYPNWRGSIGLRSNTGNSEVSFQGEIAPFPTPGSLLTFGQFQQFHPKIENYLLLVNAEKSPKFRPGLLEVRTAASPQKLISSIPLQSNSITCINLSDLILNKVDLPLFICKGMSAIPLYFSRTNDGFSLSLEHSHPPAATVMSKGMFDAQKYLKNLWFSKI